MSCVSICLFKLGLCVCGHPANARTATGSHGKWSLNSLRLACLSLRQEEVGLTIGRLFTQRNILFLPPDPLLAPAVQLHSLFPGILLYLL